MPPHPNDKERFLSRLREIAEAHMTNEQFGVNELAREMGMSRSNLHRKVKSVTGGSVSRFICKVRLERARELLNESSSSISEIAFETGFHSVTYFSKCFKDHFGYPPGDTRKQDQEGLRQEEGRPDGLNDKKEHTGFVKMKIPVIYFLAAIFFLIVVTVIFAIWRPTWESKEPLEKSIAVLPFINDSPDEENLYFINGIMESILDNLSKIEDLRVVSRNSVEQYRGNPKPTPVVSEEMNVSYVVEGSGQMDGDQIRLFIQLIDAVHDQHVWSGIYNRTIDEIFELQSEIAQLVAGEIKAIVTPEEKSLIEKIPTESRTAYDLNLKAMEKLFTDYLKAEEYLRLALEYDPAYADAYVNLGWNYFHRYQNTVLHQPECLDSVRKFIDLAIACDDHFDKAYVQRGYYNRLLGAYDRAEDDYNRALELNPNSAEAYNGKAWMAWEKNDILEAIRNFHHALNLDRGPSLADYYRYLSQAFLMSGFKEQSVTCSEKMLELNGDRPSYYLALAECEFWISKDLDKALEYLHQGYAIDSNKIEILHTLGFFYLCAGSNELSLDYFKKYEDQFDYPGNIPPYHKNPIALAYLRNGYPEVTEEYFEQQIGFLQKRLLLQENSYEYHALLAQVYAMKGEKVKVYEHIRERNQSEYMRIYAKKENLGIDLYFADFLDDPEFNQLESEIESKYDALHERVRQWLEENEML